MPDAHSVSKKPHFAAGDRVIVADLRVGKTYPGVVKGYDKAGKVIVSYDNLPSTVRVGEGFVNPA